MSFGQMRSKWRCFEKTEHNICADMSYCRARWWRGDDLGMICNHMAWATQWVIHELLCIAKFSRVKCETIYISTKIGWNWIMQQDNDPKHDSKSTTEWLEKKMMQCCTDAVSAELNEMLWNFNTAVHPQMPANLKLPTVKCCIKQWDKSLSQQCERLITSHRTKGVSKNFWILMGV